MKENKNLLEILEIIIQMISISNFFLYIMDMRGEEVFIKNLSIWIICHIINIIKNKDEINLHNIMTDLNISFILFYIFELYNLESKFFNIN
jgi:uncharacterized membrane protein